MAEVCSSYQDQRSVASVHAHAKTPSPTLELNKTDPCVCYVIYK
jgi:hypothetical protein